MLKVSGLSKYFGGVAAIDNLDLEVEKGDIRGIIGPNGAGKTTLFNVVCGVYRPSQGNVFLHGEPISKLSSSEVARRGLVRTFQRNAVFHDFTVLDNVIVGRHLRAKRSLLGEIFNPRAGAREDRQCALEILEWVGLSAQQDELAANLAHGFQRVLGVAVALATEPEILMLDEPVAGMNDTETANMCEVIGNIHAHGVTILLVEHDMKTVAGLCRNITVLDFGKKIAEGAPQEVLNNHAVIEAYLGTEDIVA